MALKDSGIADGDAIGILALDGDGKLKQDKVGAHSTGKGAAIGGVIAVFSTALLGPAVLPAWRSARFTTRTSGSTMPTRRASPWSCRRARRQSA